MEEKSSSTTAYVSARNRDSPLTEDIVSKVEELNLTKEEGSNQGYNEEITSDDYWSERSSENDITNTNVTDPSHKLVIDTWNRVKSKYKNYEMVAGVLLFRNIFEAAPEAKELFDFAKGKDDEEIFRSIKFSLHSKKVIGAIDKVVGMLSSRLEDLVIFLTDLGQFHATYGILPAHYSIVGEALINTLKSALSEEFTEKVKESWIGAYELISSTMIKGGEKT